MKKSKTILCDHCRAEITIEYESEKEFKTIMAVNCHECYKTVYLNGYSPKEKKETKEKIDVSDLNGMSQPNFKIITRVIQEFDPIKFGQKCQEIISLINPELTISYNTAIMPQQTNRGTALIFTCTVQYWGTEAEFDAWTEEIRISNLLIKP